jgi:protein-tyrosine-phosphatase
MGGMERPVRVLFVCLGNICRSPLAEGAFRKLLRERGLEDRFEVDSAGTGAWHAGEPMDPRARRVLEEEGAYFPHVARQMTREDALRFDHILVMDRENLARGPPPLSRGQGQGPASPGLPGRGRGAGPLLWGPPGLPGGLLDGGGRLPGLLGPIWTPCR